VKEIIKTLSTKLERQIEWRRSKVAELDSQGHSQPEISKILQVSIGTVNRDLSVLRQQAKSNIRKYIDERLPEEYEKCLVGLTAILRVAWNTSQQTEDRREKIQALSLAKECYSMKLDLLTNATVVDDAIRFVSSSSKNQKEEEEGRQQQKQQPQQISSEEQEEKAKANCSIIESQEDSSRDDIQRSEEQNNQQQQDVRNTTNQTF
jgi:hypothetical protein